MLISTQYEGPRSYTPAGSHPGRVYSLGGFGAPPKATPVNEPESPLLREILIAAVTAAVTTVVSQYALNYFFKRSER